MMTAEERFEREHASRPPDPYAPFRANDVILADDATWLVLRVRGWGRLHKIGWCELDIVDLETGIRWTGSGFDYHNVKYEILRQ